MKRCVTEGCRREWNVCKGNPTGPSLVGSPNWMPGRGESEPNHPGDALREFSETYCSLRVSILCSCLTFTIGKVYCLADSTLMYCVDWESMNLLFHWVLILLQLCCIICTFTCCMCLRNWEFMIIWKFKQLLWIVVNIVSCSIVYVHCGTCTLL